MRHRPACVAALLLTGASCTIIDRTPPADAVYSSGCGEVHEAERGLVAHTLEVEGETRRYWLRLPDSYDPNYPFALALMLHGSGGIGPDLYALDGMVEQAALDALLVYPDAGAPTGWDTRADSPDLTFLSALIAELEASYCVDESRVMVAGHSSGGSMANELACTLGPESLALVGSYAGDGPRATSCAGPVPAWIGHSPLDFKVPIGKGRESRDQWAAENECSEASESALAGTCIAYACEAAPLWWCEHETAEIIAHDWPKFAAPSLWAAFNERE